MIKRLTGFQHLNRIDKENAYKNAVKALRKNVIGFDAKDGINLARKLTASQKKQIRRYYNELDKVEAAPSYKMKQKELKGRLGTDKGFDAVKRAAGQKHLRRRFKHAYIPYDGENVPSVEIRNGAVVFVDSINGIYREVIELNPEAIVDEDAIDETLYEIERITPDAKLYRVGAGRYETKAAHSSLETLGNEIIALQNYYQDWEKWLTHINVYYFDTMSDYRAFNSRMKLAREELAKKRKSRKRKIK